MILGCPNSARAQRRVKKNHVLLVRDNPAIDFDLNIGRAFCFFVKKAHWCTILDGIFILPVFKRICNTLYCLTISHTILAILWLKGFEITFISKILSNFSLSIFRFFFALSQTSSIVVINLMKLKIFISHRF